MRFTRGQCSSNGRSVRLSVRSRQRIKRSNLCIIMQISQRGHANSHSNSSANRSHHSDHFQDVRTFSQFSRRHDNNGEDNGNDYRSYTYTYNGRLFTFTTRSVSPFTSRIACMKARLCEESLTSRQRATTRYRRAAHGLDRRLTGKVYVLSTSVSGTPYLQGTSTSSMEPPSNRPNSRTRSAP